MANYPRLFRLRTCSLVLITPFLVWIGFRLLVPSPLRALSDVEDYRVRKEAVARTGSVLVQYEDKEEDRQGNAGVGGEETGVRGENGTVFVIFTTWLARKDKRLIHDNVLRTWRQWRPAILPVLFSHEVEERQRAETSGWRSLPFPHTACGGVPILREMFLKVLADFPETQFFGYSNGDLLLGAGLLDTIQGVARNPIILERPVLMVLRRFEVNFVNRSGSIQEFGQVEELRPLAKEMTDGSSDAFFTNRLFPWRLIPEVVPGRIGVAMWLVAASLALDVTVIDVTPTVLAVHMTTEAGNFESHSHPNANCNHELFRNLGLVPDSWDCGHIYRAQYVTKRTKDTTEVDIEAKPDKLVVNRETPYCGIDIRALERHAQFSDI